MSTERVSCGRAGTWRCAWLVHSLLIIVVSIVATTCSVRQRTPTGPSRTALSGATPAATAPDIVVDTTDDTAALGYPDSRKLLQSKDGTWFLAYRRKSRSAYSIYVARSSDGGAHWEVVNDGQPISDGHLKYPQRVPAIDEGADGTLHIVWYGAPADAPGENAHQVWYARSTDRGATWSSPIDISQVPGYTGQDRWQEHPTLTVSPSGELYVVWEGRDQRSNHPLVKFSVSDDNGSTWTPARDLSDDGLAQSRPSLLFLSPEKPVVLAYETDAGGVAHIVASSRGVGAADWNAWTMVSPPDEDARSVSAVVVSGRLIAMWRSSRDQHASRIDVSGSADGSNWDVPSELPSSGRQFDLFPSVGSAAAGLYATFVGADDAAIPHEDPTTGDLMLAKRDSAGVWTVRKIAEHVTLASAAREASEPALTFVSVASPSPVIVFVRDP